jgi:hypothetical protein
MSSEATSRQTERTCISFSRRAPVKIVRKVARHSKRADVPVPGEQTRAMSLVPRFQCLHGLGWGSPQTWKMLSEMKSMTQWLNQAGQTL